MIAPSNGFTGSMHRGTTNSERRAGLGETDEMLGRSGPAAGKQNRQTEPRGFTVPRRRLMALLVFLTLFATIGAYFTAPGTFFEWKIDGVLIEDRMNRGSLKGWGEAERGGRYSSRDSGDLAVARGAATVRLPRGGDTRAVFAPPVRPIDIRATVDVRPDLLPTGSEQLSAGIELSRSGSHSGSHQYLADLQWAAGGMARLQISKLDEMGARSILATVDLAPSSAPRRSWRVEFQVVGLGAANLRARAWLVGDPAPDWQIDMTDRWDGKLSTEGRVGIVASARPNAHAQVVHLDNFLVVSLKRAIPTRGGLPSAILDEFPDTSHPPNRGGEPSPFPRSSRLESGSVALGTTDYPFPAESIFVSPDGSDLAGGSIRNPVRSLAHAIAMAGRTSTIVLREGVYHESVVLPVGKKLTVQPYPHEVVWLDGSTVVSDWEASGGAWVAQNWTAQFDASPTYTFGAPDNEDETRRFVNPMRPMASHPDQLWIDGVAQIQVAYRALVQPGTFFVDYAAQALFVGTDPRFSTVHASELTRAVAIRGVGSVLRGIGVRRFAPSVAHMGAVTAERDSITLENLVIVDNSTTGLFVQGRGSTVAHVTTERNGMLGASASLADELLVKGLLARDNNTEGFNNSPVSGGLKVTRSEGVRVLESAFLDNGGPGLWFDESVFEAAIVGNDVLDNAGHGLILEISSNFTIVNNVISGNRDNGLKINNTSSVRVWSNTLSENGRSLNIVQDSRRSASATTPGHDPRQPVPDPRMTWITGPVEIKSNVLSSTVGDCQLCVEDFSGEFAAEDLGVVSQSNLYARQPDEASAWLAVWSRAPLAPLTFVSLADFRGSTGQEIGSREVFEDGLLTPAGRIIGDLRPADLPSASLFPSALGGLIGRSERDRIGAWFP